MMQAEIKTPTRTDKAISSGIVFPFRKSDLNKQYPPTIPARGSSNRYGLSVFRKNKSMSSPKAAISAVSRDDRRAFFTLSDLLKKRLYPLINFIHREKVVVIFAYERYKLNVAVEQL